MEIQVLRESIKGYKKNEVMMKLDSLNMLLSEVQSGSISKEDALAKAQAIAGSPMSTALFNGFNKEDTDSYIRELVDKIDNL